MRDPQDQSEPRKKLLTPKYDPQFDQELERLHADWFRAEEFIQGAEWVLVHDPTAGHQVAPGSTIWCISVVAADGIPDAMIYYSFNDTEVRFRSIRTIVSLN